MRNQYFIAVCMRWDSPVRMRGYRSSASLATQRIQAATGHNFGHSEIAQTRLAIVNIFLSTRSGGFSSCHRVGRYAVTAALLRLLARLSTMSPEQSKEFGPIVTGR